MKNLSISFIASLSIQFFSILTGIISARLLLPIGKGELTTVILWPSMLASIGSLGVIDAIAYYISTKNKAERILGSGLFISLTLSCILICIGFLVLPFFLSNSPSYIIRIAKLYLLFIPINLTTLSLMSVLLGRLQLIKYNFLRVMVHVCNLIGMLLLYFLKQPTVEDFAIIYLASNFITCFCAVILVKLNISILIFDFQNIRLLLSYGLQSHIGSVASWFNLRLDQLLMSVFLDAKTLGLYVVAVTISSGALLIATTMSMVAFPRIANIKDDEDKKQIFSGFVKITIVLSIIGIAVLYIIAPYILVIFFGKDYLPSLLVARILLIGSIPLSANIILTAGFKAFNLPGISSKAELISLSVTGIFLWLFLGRYGIIGAGMVSLFSYLASFIFMVLSIKKNLNINILFFFSINFDDLLYLKSKLHLGGL